MSGSSGSSRRGFLRELIRGAASSLEGLHAAGDAAPAPETIEIGGGADAYGQPAAPSAGLASAEDLRELCAAVGLDARADDVLALARVSSRLTPAGDGTAQLGGAPALPPGLAWPSWRGEPLTFVLGVDLAALGSPALPRDGTLLLFFATAHAPSGRSPDEGGACRVIHVHHGAEDSDHPSPLRETLLAASAELTLPPEPEALVLALDELPAWDELRAHLAAAQGVELEEIAAEYHALHRVLGWPDAVAQSMEVEAELVASGVDLDEGHADDAPAGGLPWTLLFQVSSDEGAGLDLPLYERLYVWIRETDLAAARFDDVRAFVR